MPSLQCFQLLHGTVLCSETTLFSTIFFWGKKRKYLKPPDVRDIKAELIIWQSNSLYRIRLQMCKRRSEVCLLCLTTITRTGPRCWRPWLEFWSGWGGCLPSDCSQVCLLCHHGTLLWAGPDKEQLTLYAYTCFTIPTHHNSPWISPPLGQMPPLWRTDFLG